jgi:hypothetical protein
MRRHCEEQDEVKEDAKEVVYNQLKFFLPEPWKENSSLGESVADLGNVDICIRFEI